ncbi:hypothetical protein [Aestuariivirga sp.]|uniref:hypothetical protein n=1 Tax=Aestuariivirga sp. TaxID=2650926 RepID=UPI0039E480D8
MKKPNSKTTFCLARDLGSDCPALVSPRVISVPQLHRFGIAALIVAVIAVEHVISLHCRPEPQLEGIVPPERRGDGEWIADALVFLVACPALVAAEVPVGPVAADMPKDELAFLAGVEVLRQNAINTVTGEAMYLDAASRDGNGAILWHG